MGLSSAKIDKAADLEIFFFFFEERMLPRNTRLFGISVASRGLDAIQRWRGFRLVAVKERGGMMPVFDVVSSVSLWIEI